MCHFHHATTPSISEGPVVQATNMTVRCDGDVVGAGMRGQGVSET